MRGCLGDAAYSNVVCLCVCGGAACCCGVGEASLCVAYPWCLLCWALRWWFVEGVCHGCEEDEGECCGDDETSVGARSKGVVYAVVIEALLFEDVAYFGVGSSFVSLLLHPVVEVVHVVATVFFGFKDGVRCGRRG